MEYLKSKIRKNKEYIMIFLIVVLIMLPFIISNEYITGDDTNFHMSNIYERYIKLKSGNLEMKILPEIARNFGYGTGIFYPELGHMLGAIMTLILGGNIVVAIKIIHFLTYFLAAIMMYKLVLKISSSKYSALISAILYITFPYSITEVFRRDALAESFIFIFIPMIVLGLYELFNENKKQFYIWFVIGYIGIINSHLVMAVYFTLMIMIYIIMNIKKVVQKENLKALIIASVLILLITAPFTVPLLEHKIQGSYNVFEDKTMATPEGMIVTTLLPLEFFLPSANTEFETVEYFLNPLAVILVIMAVIRNKKILEQGINKKIFWYLVILIILTTFLISGLCPWKYFPNFLIMLQFAWRLETILIFAISVLAGLALSNLQKRKAKIIWMGAIIIISLLCTVMTYKDIFTEYNIENIDISTYGMGWQKEYLPTETIQNIEYFETRNQEIIVKDGEAKIDIKENNTPYLKAEILNCDKETTIELPRIYYLGYSAEIIDKDANITKLDLYKNENGFIEAKIEKKGILELKYTGTTLNKIANYICAITVILILIKCANNYKIIDRLPKIRLRKEL